MDPDRTGTWDENNAIREVLGPKGGLAVWIRADEHGARAAVRRGPTDAAAAAIMIAGLQLGVDRIADGIAKAIGIDPETLRRMTADAKAMLEPHIDHATRITPSKED